MQLLQIIKLYSFLNLFEFVEFVSDFCLLSSGSTTYYILFTYSFYSLLPTAYCLLIFMLQYLNTFPDLAVRHAAAGPE